MIQPSTATSRLTEFFQSILFIAFLVSCITFVGIARVMGQEDAAPEQDESILITRGSGTFARVDQEGNVTMSLNSISTFDHDTASVHDGKLLFAKETEQNLEIYMKDITTGSTKQLTSNDVDDSQPMWTADGSKILYTTERSGTQQIHQMDKNGQNDRAVTDGNTPSHSPEPVPGGENVLILKEQEADGGTVSPKSLLLLDSGGNQKKTLLQNRSIFRYKPDPSGKHIAVSLTDSILIYNLQTGNVSHELNLKTLDNRLTTHGAESIHWSPDGTKLACKFKHLESPSSGESIYEPGYILFIKENEISGTQISEKAGAPIAWGTRRSFKPLSGGSQSGVAEETFDIFYSPDAWTKFKTSSGCKLDLPEVDFQKEMVLGLFMGRKNTGGYSIEIIDLVETPHRILPIIRKKTPGPDAIVPQALTTPYQLIRTDRVLKPVLFLSGQDK